MRKSFFASAIIAMALSMGFTSCNKDKDEDVFMASDMTPLEVLMVVQNAEGQNLLDPNTPNNFVGDTIVAEWMGEKYVADTLKYMQTRENIGYMYGLVYVKTKADSVPALYFGSVSGHESYDDTPITIHWPDSSVDVVSITASYEQDEKGVAYDLVRIFKLNGNVVSEGSCFPRITIVK
ncbi:MAG: hypothetical protein IKV24_03900 [Bacteroidaceae bacterium]|nr:hypothetical protein [Bacteroidaceae bacterium]